MINPNFPNLPVSRQCELLDIARSSYYYKPVGESPFNLMLMDRIDMLHIDFPAWGSRKIRDRLPYMST